MRYLTCPGCGQDVMPGRCPNCGRYNDEKDSVEGDMCPNCGQAFVPYGELCPICFFPCTDPRGE